LFAVSIPPIWRRHMTMTSVTSLHIVYT